MPGAGGTEIRATSFRSATAAEAATRPAEEITNGTPKVCSLWIDVGERPIHHIAVPIPTLRIQQVRSGIQRIGTGEPRTGTETRSKLGDGLFRPLSATGGGGGFRLHCLAFCGAGCSLFRAAGL